MAGNRARGGRGPWQRGYWRLREVFAASVFGLILALTPPALWIAWSETMFFAILGIGAVAGGLFCLLVDAEDPALEGRGDRSVPEQPPA